MGLINTALLARFWENVKQKLSSSASNDLSNVSAATFAQKMREAELEAIYTAESTDGILYTVTVPGVTELKHGMRIVISPSRASASTSIKLNVNGLGEKYVRLPLSFNNIAAAVPKLTTFYTANKPMLLMYDADYVHGTWKAMERPRVSAQDLYGTVPMESGGTGATTAEEALIALGAVAQVDYDTKIAELESRLTALESK